MSGRLSLAATGIQGRWITEEPQYSHFLSRFRRHTKFAFEQIEIPFEKFKEYGSEMTCRIPNNAGDLIKNMNLAIDLPSPSPPPDFNKTYELTVDGSGFIYLDGNQVDRLNIYMGATYVFHHTEPFTLSLTPGGAAVSIPALPDAYTVVEDPPGQFTTTINVPITSYFTPPTTNIPSYENTGISTLVLYRNSNSGHFMVLAVRQLRWNTSTPTKMIQYADLIIGGQTIQRITGEYIYMHNQLTYTNDDQTLGLISTTLHNRYPIINDNVYYLYTRLTKYKVNLPFYFKNFPSLAIPTCALKAQQVEVKIKFRPVDDLVVDFDLQTLVYGPMVGTSGGASVELRSMSLYTEFVYLSELEKSFIRTRPIEYVITQTQVAEIKMAPGVSKRAVMINFEHPVKELFFICTNTYMNKQVKIKHATLKFNNHVVIDADQLQLMDEQPLRHHTSGIRSEYPFGVYSFSMDPERYYPTGQVNMSRVIHKLLEVEIDNTGYTNLEHTVRVYASNYNVLRVNGGIAGLKF